MRRYILIIMLLVGCGVQTEYKTHRVENLSWESNVRVGRMYCVLGENDKAIEYCKGALQMLPVTIGSNQRAVLMHDLGFYYSLNGQDEKALEVLYLALEMSDNNEVTECEIEQRIDEILDR